MKSGIKNKAEMDNSIIILILLVSFFIFFYSLEIGAEVKLASKMTHLYQAEPGKVYKGEIKLINTGKDMERVYIYKNDYTFDARGNSFYEKPGFLDRSNSDWIQLRENTVDISPQNYVNIYYEIKIPENADKKEISGTFWSVIIIEPADSSGIDSQSINTDNFMENLSLGQRFRYALQVITDLGEEKGEIEIIDPELIKSDKNGEYIFTFDLHNTGKIWLNPEIWIELYQPDGKKEGIYQGNKLRLFPGTSIHQKIPIDFSDKGIYPAILLIDNENSQDIFGYQYELEIK
ncbi:MAG: hypothetical protein ACOCQS_01165 [Bacillota bacterium]